VVVGISKGFPTLMVSFLFNAQVFYTTLCKPASALNWTARVRIYENGRRVLS